MRPKTRLPQQPLEDSNVARCVVFTAVDGTLLDSETFEPGPNRAIVQRLHAAGVPVVPVTVMTLDEIEPIAADLGIRQAMVIEAGGAIARWVDGAWQVEACGPPADTLIDVVREIEDRSGADLSVYSVLPHAEAARLSGRSGDMLLRSTRRRFSEPFVIERGEMADVVNAASAIGFTVRRSPRFFYLCRECDEGEAFTRLREELRCEVSIGIGGSPLDAEFLSRADIPIIIPRRDGEPDPELVARVPNARIAPKPAPHGWAAAVQDVWPPRVSSRRRVRRA